MSELQWFTFILFLISALIELSMILIDISQIKEELDYLRTLLDSEVKADEDRN